MEKLSSIFFAIIGAIFYGAVVVVSFFAVEFMVEPAPQGDVIYIDVTDEEPPKPKEEDKEPPKRVSKTPASQKVEKNDKAHSQTPSEEPKQQQTSGKQEQTRTVNSRALYKQSTSGADAPTNAGNPHAEEAPVEENNGTGKGLNVLGEDVLDAGLMGRGVVGDLPLPDYPGKKSGKVVIRVAVDRSGKVTQADFEQRGSTTNDKHLIDAAIRAAMKARFGTSLKKDPIQWGSITYTFKLK